MRRLSFIAVAVGALVACNDTEGYVVEKEVTKEAEGAPVGSACTLDSECQTGRCVGGVCTTDNCETDADCREDEACVFGECTPETDFECTADIHPIIDVNPAEIDFGAVLVGDVAEQIVTVKNLGSCLLTIQAVGFSSTTPGDFTCEGCEPDDFPVRIPPNRSMDVTVKFSPTAPGERTGQLQVRSDDEEYPTLSIPLIGRYEGQPRLLVEPQILDFGYVAAASTVQRTVRLSNVGSGNAVLTLTDVRLASAALPGFSFEPAINFPANTVVLTPTVEGATDCIETGGCIDITVTFTPPAFQVYTNDLLVTYEPAAADLPYATVQLKGFSTTPPVLTLSEDFIDFGDQMLGTQVDYRVVSITNNGQTPMEVQVTMSPLSSTDFSVDAPSPLLLPVAPGDYATIKVHYDPTILGEQVGEIRIATNDPQTYNAAFGTGTKTITVRGNGTPNVFNDIMKVEMTFENGDSGFFGNDFRDVNLILESPGFDLCQEPDYITDLNGQITGIFQDYCAQWTTYGTPQWTAIGAAREPERIILNNAGQASGDYTVSVTYIEDCASIPSGMLAGLLGIGTDALVGYISGGLIDLDSGAISDMIAENCWDHAGSDVTVTIFINGSGNSVQCASHLGNKGQTRPVARVNRTNGQFTATCL
ncbi:MAG: choice-of-anchor D domain-containing protein [Myxococcota bacterium]